MKKTLSLVLALALAVSMIASFALIVPEATASKDPFVLTGIKVTDAAGYAAPYVAVDNAAAFVENQAAYVVVSMEIKGKDTNKFDAISGGREITVTSSTLDLSYAKATEKYAKIAVNGGITLAAPITLTYADGKVTLAFNGDSADAEQDGGKGVSKYFAAFIAVTKPAVAGEVKASLKVSEVKFATTSGLDELKVYDATGLKYVITADSTNLNFVVYSDAEKKNELFGYQNVSGGGFAGLTHSKATTGGVTVDYFGKISYKDFVGNVVDITETVNAVNAFFGFSFANTKYPVLRAHFEAKTSGNPIVVSDTYNYITATIDDGDEDVDIAPTGDFSANIVIVMAASAVLAAAALAFVAKKARD